MKKMKLILLFIVLIFMGCSNDSMEESIQTFNPDTILSKSDFDIMYSNPDSKKGASVDFNGRVFSIEKSDDGVIALQVMSDIENHDKNIIVYYIGDTTSIKEDDLVNVQGVVDGSFEGENMMGGTVTAPMIITSKVEVTDYMKAVRPAIKTIEVNQEQTQHDFTLEIKKIELAEKETRVYVNIINNSNDNVNFYSFNSKLIQGKKQYEEEGNYEGDYPEVQSEISPKIESEGIITYGPIADNEPIKLNFEASSDNYDKEFKLFTFEININ